MTRDQFDDIIRQLYRRLYIIAFRILRIKEEAEDAVQEIFIKLWKMRDTLDSFNSIDALATTMTKNFCIDRLRKKRPDVMDEMTNIGSSDNIFMSPHDQLENKESDDIIQSIVEKLPLHFRTVVTLRDIKGFSYEEIAVKTGLNINTLRVNLSRARNIIREEYNKYHNEKRGIRQASRKVL